jgi:methylglutamate dehydrogenase subunit C
VSVRPHRMSSGGRLDRSQPISFTFDRKRYRGFAGDTLASALLANGVMLMGRSFKYHRPRGVVSAGVDEPNALVTLGAGGRREPNIPATMVEIVEGLAAESQNRSPSLAFDIRELNRLAGPLIAAGFYYKTFMGPRRDSWMVYEPFIRQAAGLGRGTFEKDPDRYDTRHEFCDVLVIGAGPAGLSAALAAGRSGARTIIVEQDSLAGGFLLFEPASGTESTWLDDMLVQLRAQSNVSLKLRTTAFGLYDGSTVALLERRDHLRPDPAKGQARQIVTTLRAKAIVFATGALERPLVFTNNDRPGVMLASAARAYVNRFAVVPGRHAVIVTNNSSAYRTGIDLAGAGLSVTIADLRPLADGDYVDQARARRIDVHLAAHISDVTGKNRVESVLLSTGRRLPCDVLCMSGGWSPAVHLTSHTGIKPRYAEEVAAFVPGGLAPGHFGAGALIGLFGNAAVVESGWVAGAEAARHAGCEPSSYTAGPAALALPPPGYEIEPLWGMQRIARGKAFVDFQNDVTLSDLKLAHREGYQSVEHLKRYTTLGMGTDQGKTSNVNALAIMSGLRGLSIPETGTTTFRPPYTPVSIGALAGRAIGHHFRPIRRSPLHDWHIANGATMIEAGVWMRAWYYAWAGSTPETAYIEEMKLVRRGVGISDVSTLGKIDLQGPDSAEFLNRLYVNGFAKLPVGKARYGVMLTDDGVVFDDGTTTRLGHTRYFMTTTTAQAGEVMSWLEFLLQTAWTDLKVHVTSLTDEWAAIAVSGPNAREALAVAFPDVDVSNERLPYMGALEFGLDGVPVRLIRLSFSGELAYEVYTPAGYGVSLWERILAKASPLGIKPYGLEALASLRIEKGHVAGLELDHRNTLDDLGLGRMASAAKSFVGKELSVRPDLAAEDRWSLVGIECLEPGKRLRGGSILFAAGEEIKGHGRGYITSVTWSTELDCYIALGLYQGGLRHEGQEIICAFPLKDEQVKARVVSPHFVDREGARLNA